MDALIEPPDKDSSVVVLPICMMASENEKCSIYALPEEAKKLGFRRGNAERKNTGKGKTQG